MPFLSEGGGGRGGSPKSNNNSLNSSQTQHISLADLKQQVGLTSISGSGSGGGSGGSTLTATLRSHSHKENNSNNNSNSSNADNSAAINIQKIIKREAAAAAAAAANLNNSNNNSNSGGGNNYRNSTEAAAAALAAAQRKRRMQMAKMLSNGGGGGGGAGMATISFASSNNHHHPHRSHGSSSGLNNSSLLHSSGERGGGLAHLSSSSNNPNDPMFVSNRRARSNNFTLKETFDLLKVWASPEMQWQMKHNFRNFRVWEAISYQMGQMGHDRTAIQCKNRIQNLTSIFYRIKKSKQDHRTFNFPYYKLIGDVLDGKKAGVSLGANFASTAHAFGIPHPNDPFLNAAALAGGGGGGGNGNGLKTDGDDDGEGDGGSPDDSDTGFAQHFALVEEYQHLINGQPDAYGSASRLLNGLSNGNSNSSSNGGIGGLVDGSVLSPEISMSEGDSPIRIDGGQDQPTKNSQSKNTPIRNGPSGSSKYDGEPTSILKIEHDDSMNITLEDAGGDDDENEQGGGGAGGYDMEDSVGLDEEEEYNKDNNEVDMAGSRTKRSFVSSFGNAINHMAKGSSFPIKRPRGVSAASSSIGLSFPRLNNNNNLNGSSTDPIVSYLADMVDIERQWLEMERERADNERSMMMYMMQILQALVCPQEQEDDDVEAERAGSEGAAPSTSAAAAAAPMNEEAAEDGDFQDQQTTDDQDEEQEELHRTDNMNEDEAAAAAAQLREMLRDNEAEGEDQEEEEEEGEDGEEGEGEDDEQEQQQLMMMATEIQQSRPTGRVPQHATQQQQPAARQEKFTTKTIEINTAAPLSNILLKGKQQQQHHQQQQLTSSVTITKTNAVAAGAQ